MDVTREVMETVVSKEKTNVRRWRIVFWLVVGLLFLIGLLLGWQIWQVVQNRGSLDLLTLFGEDREIIGEFWQDNLVIFWEELPHWLLLITAVVLSLIVAVWAATKKTRQVNKKKSETFSKFKTY